VGRVEYFAAPQGAAALSLGTTGLFCRCEEQKHVSTISNYSYLLHPLQAGGRIGKDTKGVSSVCKWRVSWAGHEGSE
jgi:hypothetical protein